MIKTAKEILLERGANLDGLKAEKKDSKQKRTMAMVNFITSWLEKHEVGEVLQLHAVENPGTKDFTYEEIQEDATVYEITYSYRNIFNPLAILQKLGFEAYDFQGRTYVSLPKE